MSNQQSKPIAIHLHLYYTELWEELSQQLQNINGTPYQLFVTIVEDNPQLVSKIKQFSPSAVITVVPNMGYDVGPFIEFLNSINLDEYSYILKLHSKRPINGLDVKIRNLPVSRKYWKILLSEALIGSPQIWQNNLEQLSQNSKIGMIASPHLIKSMEKSDANLLPRIHENLQKINLSPISDFSFVAGTMFLVRSQLLKVLQHQYKITDFNNTDKNVSDGTLAHVMERLFGAIIKHQGYTINGFSYNYKFICNAICKLILRFFYQSKVTNKNKLLIKILRIPVYQKKL